MFGSLFDIASNVVKIAVAPVKIVSDVTGAIVKPIAELAEEIVEEVRDTLK